MKPDISQELPGGDFQGFYQQSIAEGVIGGIFAFVRHNNVNLKPTEKSRLPLNEFVSKLLAEFAPGEDTFPFSESFKEYVEESCKKDNFPFRELYDAKDFEFLRGLLHMVGGEAAASFLDRHREESLRVIRTIRGE